MKPLSHILLLATTFLLASCGTPPFTETPTDAVYALTHATSGDLYSLKPSFPSKGNLSSQTILGHLTLSQDQTTAITSAIKATFVDSSMESAASGCVFEPTTDLRLDVNGTYDFMLNASCDMMEIYRNDQRIVFLGEVSYSDSQELKTLIDAIKIPPLRQQQDGGTN